MKKKANFTSKNKDEGSDDDDISDLDDFEAIGDDEEMDDELIRKLRDDSEEMSSEEEVYGIHSSSSDESEHENNISDRDLDQEPDDMPDPKAWGKKRKTFYNADSIIAKGRIQTEEEEEALKLEEEEARLIQRRLVSELDHADLSLDVFADETPAEAVEDEGEETVRVDLSLMSQGEKLKLLKKRSPELIHYVEDFKRLSSRINELNRLFGMKISVLERISDYQHAKNYHKLLEKYRMNISFYFMLKSENPDAKDHPVFPTVAKFKSNVDKLEKIWTCHLGKFVKDCLEGRFDKFLKKEKAGKWLKSSESVAAKSEMEYSDFEEEENGMELPNDKKRGITYEIAKNRGLTPRRKKELRNPRVKHRMKYRQAKIRRKGQVREVMQELRRYDGEISGIKAGTVKSVKLF